MSYIRLKKIKNNKYAYLVENNWGKKGPRQKVKEYLGRVLELDSSNKQEFFEYLTENQENKESYLLDKKKNEIIKDLIKYELKNKGFDEDSKILIKERIKVDLSQKTITKGNANVVLELNEGFLCNNTLKELFNIKLKGEDPQEKGYHLAKTLVNAGLNIPKEVFIELYNKINKD